MDTMDHRDQKPISLLLLTAQIALSAVAFLIIMPIMAIVMPLRQLGMRLISNNRHRRTDSFAPVLIVEPGGYMHTDELRERGEGKPYHLLLRHFLTEEVKGAFKEPHERPTSRIYELIRQLDRKTPPVLLFE